ncbi:hypothetical protein O181_025632 [Austropuccinia psidii MF-1]|uniref:CCHC-type domain-containing protein n=1 Tax=Austropuccinia psidii MF-1 TaxID=1389203 RepID=A0A9Q3CLK5_9BASI|nr:hypothetical protein [Austropuccinia psidii MF-1]
MSPVHLRNLGIPRNKTENRESLSRTRRPGRGHLGHSAGWKETEENDTHSAINLPIQQKIQTRGLEGYGSSSSAQPTPQRSFPMEHGQQEISGQESPFFQIPGRFKGKKDLFQTKAERVRTNDPESVVVGERSVKEPEIVLNTSRINIPNNRNITHTQNEHSVFTPEINLNSDALWLQMSQNAEKTLKQFAELQESHLRMEKLTASMEKIVKTLQEVHAQLSKASEGTNKRQNQFLEERHHCKSHILDDPYHQEDIKADASVENKARYPSQCQDENNMSYSDNESSKQLPEAARWPKFSGTGECDHMELIDSIDGIIIDVLSIPDYWITASLNTEFKIHASIWYTEMKEIHFRRNWPWWESQIIQKYRNGTWIWKKTMSFENGKYSVDNNPYEWCLRQSKRLEAINPQKNIQMGNHKLLTQIPGELEHAVKCRCNKSCTIDEIENTLQDLTKRTNTIKYLQYRSISFKEEQPFRVAFKDKPKEKVAEVTKKKNSCHNCGSTDHYANSCLKAKKKVYAIEQVPEEEYPTEDSESDSMGDSNREKSDEDQDPREELLVEYKEETQLEIQEIQLVAGMPQDTANKNLCKNTQDAQTFLVTQTKGMAYIHGTATKMTVCIYKSQPSIIESGEHCSIVAKDYMDSQFPNWEKQLLLTTEKNFKSALGKMTSIGTIIKEIIIPHRKGNIRLNPEFVVLEYSHIQGLLLGTDYQRMCGIDIYNSKNSHITIGTNKEKKFALDIYQMSTHDTLEELLNEFIKGQFSTNLTSK